MPDNEHLLRQIKEQQQRIQILCETIAAFAAKGRAHCHHVAHRNLESWSQSAAPPKNKLEVINGDWGEVTAACTRRTGHYYAVLNMANAEHPGGGYLEGAPAQEENMFRRTDCHFCLDEHTIDKRTGLYTTAFSNLLNGKSGKVYLDSDNPRVCIRGKEDPLQQDLGYRWLDETEYFPFLELRAAAFNTRRNGYFDWQQMNQRIKAQIQTLAQANVRHAVLSAFGCGAFANPAQEIAIIYREQLLHHAHDFDHVVFAIHHPNYGPDNFTPFFDVLHDLKGF